MKQIIGYIKYDYMSTKQGLAYMALVFLFVVGMFCMKNGSTMAVGYMMFGGLVMAGSTFAATTHTVSFTALAPGRIWQKVAGRYLSGALMVTVFGAAGALVTILFSLTGLGGNAIPGSYFMMLLGVSFIFLAIQNVLLYLLTPYLGMQLAGLARMLPAFVMFFGVSSLMAEDGVMAIVEKINFAVMLPAAGVILLILSAAVSCCVIRNRDNE